VTSLIIQYSTTIRFIEQDDTADTALRLVNENPELGLVLGIPEGGVQESEERTQQPIFKKLKSFPFQPFPAAHQRKHTNHRLLQSLGASQDLQFQRLIETASIIIQRKRSQMEREKADLQTFSVLMKIWGKETTSLARREWWDESKAIIHVKAILQATYCLIQEIATQEMKYTCAILNIVNPQDDQLFLDAKDIDRMIK
jgi:hypothetical protein